MEKRYFESWLKLDERGGSRGTRPSSIQPDLSVMGSETGES